MKHIKLSVMAYGMFWLVGVLALAACSPAGVSPATPTLAPDSDQSSGQGMVNPASAYCEEQGGVLEMRTDQSGGTYGVCIFPDGSECEEWAYFRGECAPGTSPQPEAPADAPAAEPAGLPQPAAQAPAAPTGIFVNAGEGLGYRLYGLDGQLLGEWLTASPMFGRNEGIHLAGSAGTLVFLGSQDNVPALMVSQQGALSPLVTFPQPQQFGGMVGLPGSTQIAYTAFEPAEDGTVVRSRLFVGEPGTLSSAAPVLTYDSRESTFIQPLALHTGEAGVEGVWYTYTMWGIGGGPLVDPRLGLVYLDLATGSTVGGLGTDQGFSGLSPDQTWAAWVTIALEPVLNMNNRLSGAQAAFNRLPGNMAGPSFATISPGNAYVAWQEGTDAMSVETYRGTLRIGTLAGETVADYPDSFFQEMLGLEVSSVGLQIRPVAWLDDRVLLVSVFQPEYSRAWVVGLDVTSGGIALTLDGYYMGLAYP